MSYCAKCYNVSVTIKEMIQSPCREEMDECYVFVGHWSWPLLQYDDFPFLNTMCISLWAGSLVWSWQED